MSTDFQVDEERGFVNILLTLSRIGINMKSIDVRKIAFEYIRNTAASLTLTEKEFCDNMKSFDWFEGFFGRKASALCVLNGLCEQPMYGQNITDGAQFSVTLLEGNKIKDTVTHCQAGSQNLTKILQPDFTNMEDPLPTYNLTLQTKSSRSGTRGSGGTPPCKFSVSSNQKESPGIDRNANSNLKKMLLTIMEPLPLSYPVFLVSSRDIKPGERLSVNPEEGIAKLN
ncbi:unnamed protein product [Orchesella dallaii]|uniref:Uncharacterized protein n=1 Tax=Orchesella dallaii TaxID=48710 RepID=A0ABP1R5V7_9HEXA